ncbi:MULTISPECIES: TraV family lipoprotein [Legionella]|uniref:TraV family lipoprotein n=1 Tax=Legionella TaxID=445 RepID=UPI0010416451|nr:MULTISPECIES: TraV family lipoprotein [Legionella]
MKHVICVVMPLISALLTGCGTASSNFSCNATAGDSCLTIEQVDAMTRFADDVKPRPSRRGVMKAENNPPYNPGRIINQENGQSVWVSREARVKSWA